MLRNVLIWALVLASASAWARVSEDHAVQLYEVNQRAGASLLQALNSASPIRQSGQVYHAYTAWHVRWDLRWTTLPSGSCKLTGVDTYLSTRMRLPTLKESSATGAAEFAAYLPALVRHEEGHKTVGVNAAYEIDAALARFQPMSSCNLLESEANRVAHEIIEKARANDAAYDAATRHGCSQGACLGR